MKKEHSRSHVTEEGGVISEFLDSSMMTNLSYSRYTDDSGVESHYLIYLLSS